MSGISFTGGNPPTSRSPRGRTHEPERFGCAGAAGAAAGFEQAAAANSAAAVESTRNAGSRVKLLAVGRHQLDDDADLRAAQAGMERDRHDVAGLHRAARPPSIPDVRRRAELEQQLGRRAAVRRAIPTSTCGLVHTYSVTVAFIVVSLLMS